MTERTAGAPPPPNAVAIADIRNRPFRDYGGPDEAYAAAVALDTIEAYQGFLAVYPDGPYSRRIAAMLAVRRKEIIWRRCVIADTPPAYWSYLRRYPNGPHAWDARCCLAFLAAALEPPPDFVYVDFGTAPPPPTEVVFVERPVIIFEGPGFASPPPPPRERFALPIAAAPIPTFVRPPRTVTLQQQPLQTTNVPGGRATVNVSLPSVVSHGNQGNQGALTNPGAPPGQNTPSINLAPETPSKRTALPHRGGPGTPVSPTAPSSASIKPAPVLPHPGGPIGPNGPGVGPAVSAPSNAAIKPPPPAPHPGGTGNGPSGISPNAPSNAAVKPAFPPPHPSAPSAATIKPPPPPPPPPPHPAAPSAAAVKPPSPPPPPQPPHPTPPVVRPATVAPPPPPPPPPHPAPTNAKPADHPADRCPPGKTATPNGCK
jgi:hypothetical protein